MDAQQQFSISLAGIACVATAGAGAAIAQGGGSVAPNDNSPAIAGQDLERASAAALAYTGQGRVSDTEVGDEESYYEVEVTLDDGSQVDVQLDQAFTIVSSKHDNEQPEQADPQD